MGVQFKHLLLESPQRPIHFMLWFQTVRRGGLAGCPRPGSLWMWSQVLISSLISILSALPFGCTAFHFVRPDALMWNWKLTVICHPLHGLGVLLLVGKIIYVPQFSGLLWPFCGPVGLPLCSGLWNPLPRSVLTSPGPTPASAFPVKSSPHITAYCDPSSLISPSSEFGVFPLYSDLLHTHPFCVVFSVVAQCDVFFEFFVDGKI